MKIDKLIHEHWNKVYESPDISQSGWFEECPEESLKLIERCSLEKNEPIIDIGAGASTLTDHLLAKDYTNLIASDISELALNHLQKRLGPEKSALVNWIPADVTQPGFNEKIKQVGLWHDRAVLHFLLKEEQQIAYLENLMSLVKRRGYVIIAAFSLTGVKKCSGLDVKNYDRNLLSDFLGDEFQLIESFDHLYYTPSGSPRPYVYTLFQRE